MRAWNARAVAAAAGARVLDVGPARDPAAPGPARVVIDSRAVGEGDLFVGLVGSRTDGGAFAAAALAAGAWGVLVSPAFAEAARCARPGVLLAHEDPLRGLQDLARGWRRSLGARVIGVTGSTGKTSTKDILLALLAPALRTVASPENLNTEIGLPLAVLAAPDATEALVLEMGMRGPGQIAELAAIAEPDVGVIVSIGPVHVELLGSLEAIAAAKAELIAGLPGGATAVVPVDEPLLAAHRREDVRTVTFGPGGDVQLAEVRPDGELVISHPDGEIRLRPSFEQAHNRRNLLAAVAAARALGVELGGELDVRFSSGRGELVALPGGIVLVNDCYNANPMSMRAALDDLQRTAPARRIAVLGDMLELGPQELDFHREVGAHAAASGVDVLVTVGPRAAVMADAFGGPVHAAGDAEDAVSVLRSLLREGDTVLVKASNGVGLQRVGVALADKGSPGAAMATRSGAAEGTARCR